MKTDFTCLDICSDIFNSKGMVYWKQAACISTLADYIHCISALVRH